MEIPYSSLPTLNAALNATSAILITLGFILIRQKALTGHVICMISALCTSTLFLISYIIYHLHHGATAFPGHGWIRPVYYTILITHTTLAITVVPLVSVTLYPALKSRFDKHVRLARWTFPIWLYVSITGVVIYWMLYQNR